MKTGTVIWGPVFGALVCGVWSSIFAGSLVDGWTEVRWLSYAATGAFGTFAVVFAIVAALRIDRRMP